jgi:hypothetical protein
LGACDVLLRSRALTQEAGSRYYSDASSIVNNANTWLKVVIINNPVEPSHVQKANEILNFQSIHTDQVNGISASISLFLLYLLLELFINHYP